MAWNYAPKYRRRRRAVAAVVALTALFVWGVATDRIGVVPGCKTPYGINDAEVCVYGRYLYDHGVYVNA